MNHISHTSYDIEFKQYFNHFIAVYKEYYIGKQIQHSILCITEIKAHFRSFFLHRFAQ